MTVRSTSTLGRIVEFLDGIGIVVTQGAVPRPSFLPGVRIAGGGLVYDPSSLAWPGDLLHEAGHVAVTPAALRSTLDDGVELPSSVLHATEVEATAWAYAAVVHLRLDPSVLFHSGGYGGASPGLVSTYSLGVHPGSFGLAQAGMTNVGPEARRRGLPVYPEMSLWLRP